MGGYAKMRLSILIVLLFFYSGASATIIHAGAEQKYKSVTAAVEAASSGDTVLVDAGYYREKKLEIKKTIVLKGINYPVLDGQNKYEVIYVKANGVVIDGFRVINSGISSIDDISGIKVVDSKNIIIRNNILENNFFGIQIQNGINCFIENNKLKANSKEEQQSGNGIHCWKSDSVKIIGNTISGHRDGIYFEFVTNSIIKRNNSQKNLRYGLHFMFSNNDSYVENIFMNNGAGVSVMYSHHVNMQQNIFQENWGDGSYGILLKEITDSKIMNNRFIKNTIGIFMEGVSRVAMSNNIFQQNGWGMKIQASCMDIVIKQNNFIGNTFDVSTNGSLVLNKFDGNYWDKYEGYDLDKNKIGDVPFRPVSLYSVIIEKNPPAVILFRSFITTLLDKTEKVLPSLTPENLIDNIPNMKPFKL